MKKSAKLEIRLDRVVHFPVLDIGGFPVRVTPSDKVTARVYRGMSNADVVVTGDGIEIRPKRLGPAFMEVSVNGHQARISMLVIEPVIGQIAPHTELGG